MNSDNSVDMKDIPESLKVHGGVLKKFESSFGPIKAAVNTLWDHPLLDHYTSHGTDHSERIIKTIGQLLEVNPKLLGEHERFILLASAYLHDIGMQSPGHAGLPFKSWREYSLEELEKVRENHHEASEKMINESISEKPPLSLGLEQCKEYVPFIARLSKYHRKLDIKDLSDTSLGGDKINLPLLAALLRFSDALDINYQRVNMTLLKLRDIPPKSKCHWWINHYVQSVLIAEGKIKLYFRFPESHRGDGRIQTIVNIASESVTKQFYEIYDILYDSGIWLHPKIGYSKEYIPEGLELIPEELSEYLLNQNSESSVIEKTKADLDNSWRTYLEMTLKKEIPDSEVERIKAMSSEKGKTL